MKIIVRNNKTNRTFTVDAKEKFANGKIHKVSDEDKNKAKETENVEDADKKAEAKLSEADIKALKDLLAVAPDLIKLVKPDDKDDKDDKSKSKQKAKSKEDDSDKDDDFSEEDDEDVIEEDEQLDSTESKEEPIIEEEVKEFDSDIDEDEDDEEDVIEDDCGDDIHDSKASIGSIEDKKSVADSDTISHEDEVAKCFAERYKCLNK